MGQFKNKCCNHQGGSTTNPPITNFKPQGQLEPGKDPGNITQSCFVLNKLPNIETVKELAFELCNIQQAFDKCPQYYTKSNFDALINTITKALFHLYVKSSEISGESVNLQQEITYSELVELINTNSLNPGQEYRITDYTFTTTQEFTASANHDFDIIVSALNTNTLNENAKAVCKENDEYFKNSKLNLWELKYSIYNDKNKYGWADTENGKGVIYWLKDEFNNEAGYDFKNLIYKIDNKQVYTFSKLDDTDLSISGNDCYSNYIAPYFTNCLHLPINIIQGSRCKLGTACYKVQILNGLFIDIKATQNCHIKDCSNTHIFNGNSASITSVADSILENVEGGNLCHIAKSRVINTTGSDICGIIESNISNINAVSIINNNSYGNVVNWNQNYKNIYINGLKNKTITLSDILDDSYMLNGYREHCVHIRSEADLTITV